MESRERTEIFRTMKYFMFATSAGVIEMAMFTVFDQFTPWDYWPCYLISLVMSVLWNFTLNRKFTFKSNNNIPVAMGKVAVYYAIFTPISTILGSYLVESLMWNAYLVALISLLLNGVTEYLYQRLYVFGKSIDTNLGEKKKQLDIVL